MFGWTAQKLPFSVKTAHALKIHEPHVITVTSKAFYDLSHAPADHYDQRIERLVLRPKGLLCADTSLPVIEAALIQQIHKYKGDHEGNLPRQIIIGPKMWLRITGNRKPPIPNDRGIYRYMGIPVRIENKMPDELSSGDLAVPDFFRLD